MLFRRCRVEPLPSELRRQDHRPPIVHIDHAARAVGGDDDEPIMLVRLFAGLSSVGAELANAGAKGRAAITTPDQVGLLFWATLIDPLEPVVDRHNGPVRPDRAEERAVSHLLAPGIDRRGAILGPVRPPTPAH
ncbi:hypothetical protein D3C78_664310 [compost metagenome]